MKKAFCMILVLLLCVGACATLASCGCDHIFSEEWSTDDTYHWHVCTIEGCEEQSDKAEHSWDEGVMTLLPTHATAGNRKYTCKVCGKEKNESVAPEPQVDDVEWADAFLLQDDNFVMTVVNNQGVLLVKKRGGVVMTTDPQTVNVSQKYYTLEDGRYYCYTVAGETVTKGEINKEVYTNATTLADLQELAFHDFTYNEGSKTYMAESLTVDGVVYEDVFIAFAGKKVNRISFTKKEQGKANDATIITVTYGTVPSDLVLPQVTE